MKDEALKEKIEFLQEISQKNSEIDLWISVKEFTIKEEKVHLPHIAKKGRENQLIVRYINEKNLCGVSLGNSLEREDVLKGVEEARKISYEAGIPSFFPEDSYYESSLKEAPFQETSSNEEFGLEETFAFLKEEIKREKVKLEHLKLAQGISEVFLFRKGQVFHKKNKFYSFLVSVIARNEKTGKEASSYGYQYAVDLKFFNPERELKKAIRKARDLSRTHRGKTLKVHLLLSPEVVVDFLELLSFSFKADEVLKGRSLLGKRLGQKVFDERVSLVDDGKLRGLPETGAFDDEGCPQKRRILVEKGVVKDFLCDYFWKKEGEKKGFAFSPGNARRSKRKGLPEIGTTNFYILPSYSSSKEQKENPNLEEYSQVFEILEVMGLHTADPISGNFSVGISGILYEKGEPVDYLCEMNFTSNLFEIFNNLAEIGSEVVFIANWGAPFLITEKIGLGG